MTQDHIDKIIDTYQNRRSKDLYSRRVKMKEIKSNDFNLNIFRDVTTAKDEVEVDLAATHCPAHP